MAKKLTLTEEQLTGLIKKIVEQQLGDDEVLATLDDETTLNYELGGLEDEEEEEELEQILTTDEIMALMEEQVTQIQDRLQYMEELNAEDDTVAGQDIADEGVEKLSVINTAKRIA